MGSASPQEGTASNRYVIVGKLAGGGMADIFLARSTSETGIERYVVLKRVLAERSRDPHFASLFLDEARLTAQLQHPNIAQVLDVGKLAGAYFYTMEYVHGEDVRHLLQRVVSLRRELPIQHVLAIATGALAGLHHAHTRTTPAGVPLGVVHRDVSPSNIMVSYEGSVKLLDFGVAKATERSAESSSGTVKGKVAYASPEQCRSGELDRRSDIYSLGIVLWEMLASRRLYKYDTDFATMMAICEEPVKRPSELRSDVSPALDAIVLTALAKDRESRFSTAADMIEAIEDLAAREHFAMSTTGLGKLVRELFGERPEPWLEIAARQASGELQPLTVTGESVAALGTPSVMRAPSSADEALLLQLDVAPELGRREGPSTSSTLPPALDYVAPKRSRRGVVIGALVVASIVVFAIVLATNRSEPIAVRAPVAIQVDAAIVGDAASAVDAVVPDAAVVDIPLDAAPAVPLAHPHRVVRPKNPCDDQRYREQNPLKCQ